MGQSPRPGLLWDSQIVSGADAVQGKGRPSRYRRSRGLAGEAPVSRGGPHLHYHPYLCRNGAPAKEPLVGERRSEEHTSELQSLTNLVCRLLLEKKKYRKATPFTTLAKSASVFVIMIL